MPKNNRKEPYWKELNKIEDPELSIGLVDLGLIYKVDIKNDPKTKEKTAIVTMTLTSPACPVGPFLIQQVEETIHSSTKADKVYVDLVWEPIWTADMIDPDIRDILL